MAHDRTQADPRLLAISDQLIEARRSAIALPGFPGDLPKTFAEAYEIQRISRKAWDDELVGWKIGGVPALFIEKSGVSKLAGPVFASSVVRSPGGSEVEMPVFDRGFAAIEPEFIIEMGETRSEDRMYIGAEIASSPIPAVNDVGPIAIISDFGINNGVLLGPEIKNWQDLDSVRTTMITYIDGAHIGTRELDDFRKDPLNSFAFLIEHAKANNIELPAGTLASTGAITGVHEAGVGAKSRLDFGRFGKVDLVLSKAEPSA